MSLVYLLSIMLVALVAQGSPGPATLTIAGTAMKSGRKQAVTLACGVLTGSLIWSFAAALGLATVMSHSVWMMELLRCVGGVYLLWLAYRSWCTSRRNDQQTSINTNTPDSRTLGQAYLKGLGLHLTNPKAIFFFASLYTLGLPKGVDSDCVWIIFSTIGVQSAVVFLGYGFLFSTAKARSVYMSLKQPLEKIFAVCFGLVGGKILLSNFGAN